MSMTSTEAACALVLLIAQCEPDPGNILDRQAVNAARRVAKRLLADRAITITDLPPPPAPVAASGVPLTWSKK